MSGSFGISECRASFWRSTHQMYLYKYRQLADDDEQSFDRFKTILETQAFWCASPDALNDNQEFSWRCDYSYTDETLDLLARLICESSGRSYEVVYQQIQSFLENGSLERLAEPVIASLIEKCRSEIGLLCFGTSPGNSTLWSRYGGNGNGVCIEIEVPDRLIGTSLFWVEYARQKVVHINTLLLAHFGDAREMYTHSLLTKPHEWASEMEIRFVSTAQNINVRIEDSNVSRVFLGNDLSEAMRGRIASLVNLSPLKIALHKQPRG
jgi:hypothetical protein